MKTQLKRKVNALAAFLTLLFAQVPAYADTSLEKLCEAQYVELLKNAKQALVDQKREDALNFLLKATTIMETCARSIEKPDPKEQAGENRLALSPSSQSSSDNAL